MVVILVLSTFFDLLPVKTKMSAAREAELSYSCEVTDVYPAPHLFWQVSQVPLSPPPSIM